MLYFVTGATGFLGGHLVRQLVEAGHRVRALVRNPSAAGRLADLGVELFPGDIRDRDAIRTAMSGTHGVFHVAAWYRIGQRSTTEAYAVNVDGTRNVLEVMRELEIPKGVYTSTIAVFGDTHGQTPDETHRAEMPTNTVYETTKWIAHYRVAEPLQRDGLPLVITMPGLIYGPGDQGPMHTAIQRFVQRKLPVAPAGGGFCWTHVEDVARGHVQAMDRGQSGEAYILAGPQASLLDVLELGQRVTGVPVPGLRLSPSVLRGAAALMDVVGRVVPVPETYAAESLRMGAGVTVFGSPDKARRELGFAPRSLESGLTPVFLDTMRELGLSTP